MSGASFLFLMSEGLDATVIDSQVVDGLVAVRREGIRFDLLSLADGRRWLRERRYYQRRCIEVAARTGGSVRVVPMPRKLGVGGPLGTTALLLAEHLRRGGRLVVHARTDYAAYFASFAARLDRGIRYIFDCRGDGPPEFLLDARQFHLSERQTARGLRRMERVGAGAARHASFVLAVSTVLRDRLVARHGIYPTRISVVPCVADAEMLVYFLILTPDLEAAAEHAQRLLIPGRYKILSAAHAEVPGYLRASDLGMLLRAPDPLNEAACPTKFAEYVMTGLPVLISAGIGDCSGFVAQEGAGAVLPEPDPAAAVAALARIRAEEDVTRRTRIARAAERFARQRYAREMAQLYRRLAEFLRQVFLSRSGAIQVEDAPAPACGPGEVRIDVAHSVISTGTETSALASPDLRARLDRAVGMARMGAERLRTRGLQEVLRKARVRDGISAPMGYSVAGRVDEVGIDVVDLAPGALVAAGGSAYAHHAEQVAVPRNLSLRAASFATVGAIALQGVRRAAPQVGETVAVVGLGLVGQLAVQLLGAAGCRVVGVDPRADRVELARSGPGGLVAGSGPDPAEIEAMVRAQTAGAGADAVLLCAGTASSDPINTDLRAVRQRGRVVIVGAVGLALEREAFYRKEVELTMSCSYGPGRYDPSYGPRTATWPPSSSWWRAAVSIRNASSPRSATSRTPPRPSTRRRRAPARA
ncbi:MAG: gfo [Deltaproteobacteria bacterium]|nr:gfo [Deltaproteobacteria bacterium]